MNISLTKLGDLIDNWKKVVNILGIGCTLLVLFAYVVLFLFREKRSEHGFCSQHFRIDICHCRTYLSFVLFSMYFWFWALLVSFFPLMLLFFFLFFWRFTLLHNWISLNILFSSVFKSLFIDQSKKNLQTRAAICQMFG